MKSKLIVLLIILVPFKSTEACTFAQHSGDIRVASINGAKVYTLFTTHLMDQSSSVMGALLGSSTDEVIESLNGLLTDPDNAQTIRSEQNDVVQLTQIVQSGEIRWIGIEASPAEMQSGISIINQVQDYYDMRDLFNGILGNHEGWSPEKTDQILHLMFNAHIIARAKNPDAFSDIRVVPLDDNDAKAESGQTIEYIDRFRDDLIRLGADEGLLTIDQFLEIEAIKNAALQNVRPIPAEEISRLRDQFQDIAVRTIIRDYLEEVNEFLRLSGVRDQAAVTQILEQSGNGLITMGSAHGPGIEQGLTTACRNQPSQDTEGQKAVQ